MVRLFQVRRVAQFVLSVQIHCVYQLEDLIRRTVGTVSDQAAKLTNELGGGSAATSQVCGSARIKTQTD